MRALDSARRIGQTLADKEGRPYVLWTIGWRTVVQPEGTEVPGGIVVEYINPRLTEEIEA